MTTPTPERHRHGEIVPPAVDGRSARRWWTARSRLSQLYAAGAIDGWVYSSAVMFRGAAEASMPGLRSSLAACMSTGRSGIPEPSHRALDAARWLRRAHALLGPSAYALVWACVVEDRFWAETGRVLGIDRETVRRRTIVALGALAGVTVSPGWGTVGSGGERSSEPHPTAAGREG